jgi:predicted ferric reductase
VFLSVAWIRHRLYETFYFSHVTMALVYLGLLFWHADNLGDSWAYLWATLAILLAQWLARLFYYTRPFNLRGTWLSGAMTTAKNMPGGMTMIEVSAPQDFDYRPGQHCFLRFPALSLLDNHPFTIASAPPSITARRETAHELLFMARTYSGFTKKLSKLFRNTPEKPLFAWVDGPYGGVSRLFESQYDTLVLIAGGSGITACLPWIKCLVQAKESRVTRVALRWAVKERSHLAWAEEALKEVRMLQQHTKERVEVDVKFSVTRSMDSELENVVIAADVGEKRKANREILSVSSSSSNIDLDSPAHCVYRRPDMREIVSEETQRGGKVFVICCGPETMRVDLSNAVANAQANVFAGSVQEVALHLEAFGM